MAGPAVCAKLNEDRDQSHDVASCLKNSSTPCITNFQLSTAEFLLGMAELLLKMI